jgi:hypothetical protein
MLDGEIRFAEVLYYTQLAVNTNDDSDLEEDEWQFSNVAVVNMYSTPDKALLKLSSQTLASCMHLDEIRVINVKDVISVIAMIPHKPTLPSGVMEDRFFMMERPGLDISNLGVPYSGFAAENDDDDEDVGPGVE